MSDVQIPSLADSVHLGGARGWGSTLSSLTPCSAAGQDPVLQEPLPVEEQAYLPPHGAHFMPCQTTLGKCFSISKHTSSLFGQGLKLIDNYRAFHLLFADKSS